MTAEHVSFDRLCDFADGALPPSEGLEIERHLSGCASCSAELARLRGLLARAASLAPHLEPPAAAWAAIQQRMQLRSRRGAGARRWWRGDSWGLRAAAAILLVASTSTLTVLALRWRESAPDPNAARSSTMMAPVPAALRAVDESYAGVVEELTRTLGAQRDQLAPQTIATLERTLRVIDQAIGEARAALAADPGNAALVDVLSANYEQKVHLLRRASELPART